MRVSSSRIAFAVGRVCRLRGEGDRDHGVIRLAHEGERGQPAVLGHVGRGPRLRRGVVRVAARRRADDALEGRSAPSQLDQVLALVAVREDEAREDAVLDRLAEEDLGLREAHRHQHLGAAAGGPLQLRQVAGLPVGRVRGEGRRAAEVRAEDLGEALAPGVVAEDHADVRVPLALHQLGEHDAMHCVRPGGAEQIAVGRPPR